MKELYDKILILNKLQLTAQLWNTQHDSSKCCTSFKCPEWSRNSKKQFSWRILCFNLVLFMACGSLLGQWTAGWSTVDKASKASQRTLGLCISNLSVMSNKKQIMRSLVGQSKANLKLHQPRTKSTRKSCKNFTILASISHFIWDESVAISALCSPFTNVSKPPLNACTWLSLLSAKAITTNQ